MTLPDFSLTKHRASVIKTVLLVKWQTKWSMKQNREPRNGPTQAYSATLGKGAKATQWRKGKNSIINKCWASTCNTINLDKSLTALTITNSMWLVNLNVTQNYKTWKTNHGRRSRGTWIWPYVLGHRTHDPWRKILVRGTSSWQKEKSSPLWKTQLRGHEGTLNGHH